MNNSGVGNELDIDVEAEANWICERLREVTSRSLRKRGLVVAISGGIDSSCSLALAVRALGAKHVFALILPERDSSGDSSVRGKLLAKHLAVEYAEHDIAPTLDAIGCYKWRDDAIRRVIPEYCADWRMKIVLVGGLAGQINHYKIVAQAPDGSTREHRLGLTEYLQIVASTNFKQRIRKTLEYFHADRLNYAVVGTPNRLEYDQGFFVKNGDGTADVKPIAHLYKTQVYAMAKHLGLPERITSVVPTTDTYSLPQGQDEFYFALPYDKMDLALLYHDRNLSADALAQRLGLTLTQAQNIYRDIEAKRRTTAPLHWPGILLADVPGPHVKSPRLQRQVRPD